MVTSGLWLDDVSEDEPSFARSRLVPVFRGGASPASASMPGPGKELDVERAPFDMLTSCTLLRPSELEMRDRIEGDMGRMKLDDVDRGSSKGALTKKKPLQHPAASCGARFRIICFSKC